MYKAIGKIVSDFETKQEIGVLCADGAGNLLPCTFAEVGKLKENGLLHNIDVKIDSKNKFVITGVSEKATPLYLQNGIGRRSNPYVILRELQPTVYAVLTPEGNRQMLSAAYIVAVIKRGVKFSNAKVVNNVLVCDSFNAFLLSKQPVKKFKLCVNLRDCVDSLLFNKGTQIAIYVTKDNYVSLEVYGDVALEYKDEIYHSVDEMPKELISMIKAGKVWDCEEVCIKSNNWFEYVHVLNNVVQPDDYVCEEDISKMTADELKVTLQTVWTYYNPGDCHE